MPALKPDTIIPSAQEDAQITQAAMRDADAVVLDDAQWQQAQASIRRGRPSGDASKTQIARRMDGFLFSAR